MPPMESYDCVTRGRVRRRRTERDRRPLSVFRTVSEMCGSFVTTRRSSFPRTPFFFFFLVFCTQEFLSKYVANGLVERLEVLGDRGECRATVYLSNPLTTQLPPSAASSAASSASFSSRPFPSSSSSASQQYQGSPAGEGESGIFHHDARERNFSREGERGAGGGGAFDHSRTSVFPYASQHPPAKTIVQFRSGMSAESFIEKMEAFQVLYTHRRTQSSSSSFLSFVLGSRSPLLSSFFSGLLIVHAQLGHVYRRGRRGVEKLDFCPDCCKPKNRNPLSVYIPRHVYTYI